MYPFMDSKHDALRNFVSIKGEAYPFMDTFQRMYVGSWNFVSIKGNAYPFIDTFQGRRSGLMD
jgi:hypothetical protein